MTDLRIFRVQAVKILPPSYFRLFCELAVLLLDKEHSILVLKFVEPLKGKREK